MHAGSFSAPYPAPIASLPSLRAQGCAAPSAAPAPHPRQRRGKLSPHLHHPELPASGRTARGLDTDRHSPTEGHPHLPPGNKHAGPGVQTVHGGRQLGRDRPGRGATPQACREEREGGPAVPKPCRKALPGAPSSPAAPARREGPNSSGYRSDCRYRSRPSAPGLPPAAL